MQRLLLTALIVSSLIGVSLAQQMPRLTLSATEVKAGGNIDVQGTGFTPNRYVLSHLRKPDGTESSIRRFVTNDRGEYAHRISSSLLDPGWYELWSEDGPSKALSNVVRFEVRE